MKETMKRRRTEGKIRLVTAQKSVLKGSIKVGASLLIPRESLNSYYLSSFTSVSCS